MSDYTILDEPQFGALPPRRGGSFTGSRRSKYSNILDLLKQHPNQEACIAMGENLSGRGNSLTKTHGPRGFKFAVRGGELWAVYGDWSVSDSADEDADEVDLDDDEDGDEDDDDE